MEAKFYKLTKRLNSTKQPVGTASITMDVKLKDKTDLVSPSLFVSYSDAVIECNYVEFMDKYYYIDGWSSDRNNIWSASCSLDILATYKTNILNTNCFVEYDTTANTEICDMRMHLKTTASISLEIAEFAPAPDEGCYILTATGRGGSVGMFAVSASTLSNLVNGMYTWVRDTLEDQTETPAAIVDFARQLISGGSAVNNIRGCIWVPWSVSGSSKTIWLGNYETASSGVDVNSLPIANSSYTIPIPWQAEDWRRGPFCTTLSLKLPFVGVVGLNVQDLVGASSLTIRQTLDRRTGDIAYNVYSSEGKTIGIYGGNASVSIPLGAASPSLGAGLGNAVSTVTSLVQGNFTSAATGAAKLAENFFNPTTTLIGSLTGAASATSGFQNFLELTCVFHDTADAPATYAETIGTPTMVIKSLGSLTGYVKTRAASVSAPAGSQILSEIDRYLDGGVFIE